MGGFVSKFLNDHHVEQTSVNKAKATPNNAKKKQIVDPRSPTEEFHRTPITVAKKPYLETDIDQLTPPLGLRVRLLKGLIDPRSPTEGINRTPISMMDSTSKYQEFDSPVSLYSNHMPEVESFSCLASPPEPSVNVSDFDASDFANELDSLVEVLKASFEDSEPNTPVLPRKLQLIPDCAKAEETREEAKKISEDLVREIIESFKECEEELAVSGGKLKLSQRKKNNAQKVEVVKTPKLKLSKSRKPLSNITSSAGNTPTKLGFRKEEKLIKVASSGENSPVVNLKVRAQWDHESTVII